MRALSLLLLMAAATAMIGFCLESKLIQPSELRKRVPMVAITDFEKFPLSIQTPDFLLRSDESAPLLYSLHGSDRRGKAWEVTLNDAARGAWRSDAGGSRTYYFAGYTGAAGSGPGTWILVLSFDAAGEPVPFFFLTQGSSYNAMGIDDVLDLDGDGPEILQQDYWGSMMEDPGYFVTTLYKRRGAYWYRSDGRHGAHVFPTFEKWSVMWHRPPELTDNPPPSDRAVRDYTNDPAMGLHGATITGCSDLSVDVLVTDDRRGGREVEVVFGLFAEEFPSQARRAKGTFTGLYRWPEGNMCSASIMWTKR